MAELSQQPRLDMYAQDLLRQSYQANPISQDILNQYGQGMTQQVQPPVIQNYAPQQFQQQTAMPQETQSAIQPSKKRMEYNSLVEQRFNEIADMVGGKDVLYKTGRLEKAKKAAMEDIHNIYGPPPTEERPLNELERLQLEKEKIALEQLKNPEKKPSEAMSKVATKAADYLATVDPMLGQLEAALVQLDNPSTDVNSKLANARTLGKLINSLQVGSPDAVGADEAKMLMAELNEKIFNPSGMFTSEQVFGTNLPQFIEKMKSLRDRVAEQYNTNLERVVKFDPLLSNYFEPRKLASQPIDQSTGKSAVKPAANSPIPMRFNVGTGKYEPIK